MIPNIDNNLTNKILPNQGQTQQTAPKTGSTGISAQLEVRYDLSAQALEPSDDAAVVARAKALLASGQLDTIANITEAAREIIDLGF